MQNLPGESFQKFQQFQQEQKMSIMLSSPYSKNIAKCIYYKAKSSDAST